MLSADLHEAIAQVAPIIGVSIGDERDKTTWRIDFDPSATDAQKDAAAQALSAYDALRALRRELSERVDADAERVRLRYVTPGSGMAMTYQEKFAQAQAVHSMGEEVANAMTQDEREAQFPTLSASIGLEAATIWDCAQIVLTKYSEFAQLSLLIERARLAGKSAIAVASTEVGIKSAYDAIRWP